MTQSCQYSHKGRVITVAGEGREVDEFLGRRETVANHSSCKATEAAFDGKKRVNHSRPFDAKLFLLNNLDDSSPLSSISFDQGGNCVARLRAGPFSHLEFLPRSHRVSCLFFDVSVATHPVKEMCFQGQKRAP